MQLLTLEKSTTTRLFWVVLASLVGVMVLTAKQEDPAIAAAAILLAILSALPIYLWLLGWSHGLPLWPVFVLVNGAGFALPMIQDPHTLEAYTSGEIILGGMTMMGFILLGTVFWLAFTARTPKAPARVLMIENKQAVNYLFAFIAIGVFFLVNQMTGWLRLPGNIMPVLRGVAMALNAMGLFVLAFYHGRGLLSQAQVAWLVVGTVLTVAYALTGLMIAQAIVPMALVLFGYMLGSDKFPWRLLLLVFVCVAVLHPGKYEMRNKYWQTGEGRVTAWSIPAFYAEWFGYGFEELGGLGGVVTGPDEESNVTSAFERAGSAHMLLLVMKKSPAEVPYLNGLTYEPIPRLLIPRFLDDEKGISHAGNIMLTVNYGLQTLEQTRTTSIYWGLIPEAYANFGYIGVAGLAFVLAAFYAYFARLSVGVPMTSLRFVLGLLVLAASTKADTMGVFVTTQFQAIVGISLAAVILMRRQPNPFATSGNEAAPEVAYRMQDVGALPVQFAPSRQEEATGGKEQEAEVGRPEPQLAPGVTAKRQTGSAGPRDVGRGGVVRTLPTQTPKRIARWMPRRVRQQVAAEQRAAAEEQRESVSVEQKDGGSVEGSASASAAANGSRLHDPSAGQAGVTSGRPRQVAVPYRNYRRYRGA